MKRDFARFLSKTATGLALLLALGWAGLAAAAFVPDVSRLQEIPLHQIAAPVQAKAQTRPRKNQPLQFATAIPVTLSLDQGQWQRLDAATWSWRMRMRSAGAVSLNFEFAQFQMPEGGALWIYDDSGQRVQGPYTHANQTPEGRLWTALVRGDSAVIEVRVPALVRDQLKLQLAQLNYGTTDFFKSGLFGNAGSCNVDVACPAGSNWSEEARAAVLVQAGGGRICSGVMVNNTREDNTPLLLTANHCGIRQRGVSPASSVVIYWLYQSSACNANNGDSTKSQSGSTFLATDASSDFTLLQLNQTPAADVRVHYAGWDVGTTPAQSGVGLHHASGDVKKISTFSSPLTADTINIEGFNIDAWKVSRWAQGVTEPGSSGSGLWNQNHLLVGVLSGGQSECTVDNSDPTAPTGPDQPDYYGRLDAAWGRGLKELLDSGNTGVTQLCGRDPADRKCNEPILPPASAAGGGGGALPAALLIVLLLSAAGRSLTTSYRRKSV